MSSNARWLATVILVFSFAATMPVRGISLFNPDTAWKRYHNKRLNYCVSYPSRWKKGDAFEGAGFFVAAGQRKHSRPVGEIDVEQLPDSFLAGIEPAQASSMAANFKIHLQGIKRFDRAERVEVLTEQTFELSGNPALLAKDRYYDPLDGTSWTEEIVLVNSRGKLYRLELECRADQISRFEPVFLHLMRTFQLDCNAR